MAIANQDAALHDLNTEKANHPSAGSSILSRYGAHRDLRSDRPDHASIPAWSSILSRILKGSARFFFAFLVGVGVTIAWQSYGVQWLPGSTGQPADAPSGAPEQQLKPELVAADQQLRPVGPAGLKPLLAAEDQQLAAIAPSGSAELVQQLSPIGIDLASVKETLERLAAEQGKMTQSIDRLERGQEAITQKLSSVVAPTVHAPTPRPVQHRAQPPTPR